MEKGEIFDLIRIHEETEDSDEAYELLLREIRNGNLSKHRSCWLHVAAYREAAKKLTDMEMIDIKEKFEHASPCFSDSIICRKRSKRKSRGLIGQRCKMSDGVFNNHLENIWRSLSDDKKASSTHVDSLCFFLYKNKQAKALELFKRKDIFSKKYVFVPIVCWDHWRLLVFCNFGEDANLETKTRCTLLLDSAESGAEMIVPDVKKFVLDIFKAAGRPESKDVIYRIPLLVPKVPQQTNEIDCGRFVLYFIKKFMEDAPEKFSVLNGYPYFLKADWFDYESFGKFCDKLEREIPTRKQEVDTSRRTSTRIRNMRSSSRRTSRQSGAVVFLEVD